MLMLSSFYDGCKRRVLLVSGGHVTEKFRSIRLDSGHPSCGLLDMSMPFLPTRYDFLSSFEEKFGQPSFVERSILVPCNTLCPVPLHNLPFPKALLDFANGQLQVFFSIAAVPECICTLKLAIAPCQDTLHCSQCCKTSFNILYTYICCINVYTYCSSIGLALLSYHVSCVRICV